MSRHENLHEVAVIQNVIMVQTILLTKLKGLKLCIDKKSAKKTNQVFLFFCFLFFVFLMLVISCLCLSRPLVMVYMKLNSRYTECILHIF